MSRQLFVAAIIFAVMIAILLLPDSKRKEENQHRLVAATSPVANSPSTPIQDVGHPFFGSPHFSPIVNVDDQIWVVNTPADTVDVIDTTAKSVVARIPVGVDPVSIAVRPDGLEVWVSNHVSDSVSVIDNDPRNPTFRHVIATIQEFDSETYATKFDEPVGIAFASNEKAYVALSSENQIAVIDVKGRMITKRLEIPAQDPRAILVHEDRLFVAPFESNNQTQLSGGSGREIDGDLVTFDAWQHSIFHNNVLSIGHVVDIIKHPEVPDRDLFVFDTKSDELIETVDTLGTLLYGMATDSEGSIFLAQTDARNHVNGRSGTKKHGLAQLANRAFLNQITRVDFSANQAEEPSFINLEPLPPEQPPKDGAYATPFAIQVSQDDRTLVATAAGSDKLFTVNATSGDVLGSVTVGAVPRGVALRHRADGVLESAWVFNAVANTVTHVDLTQLSQPKSGVCVALEDPTDPVLKRGRTWFNDADASTTGTFSCASCHPDGHTDQLLWVLKTPVVSGGDQIMPRSTMPIRGLQDTAPFHWDGIPGDPYGGNNSANVWGSSDPNSDPAIPESTTRHLVDGGLATTMHLQGMELTNDEGKTGLLSATQREEMAKFLLTVPYPPAQKRAFTNQLSNAAKQGFELFHIKGHLDEKAKPNVCGDCHRMPFLVSTNTPGTGMDAPTWRGAYDRFLILPQGRLNIIDFDFYRRVAERGIPEREVWQFSWQGQRRFDPIWDMVLEGSTGFSGAFGRQFTLNNRTVDDKLSNTLWDALELSADDNAVVLEAECVFTDALEIRAVSLQYVDGVYLNLENVDERWTRSDLKELASSGKLVATLTGKHGVRDVGIDEPQPALWTLGPLEKQSGHQRFPILHPDQPSMKISGRHIHSGASIFVDGRKVLGDVEARDDDDVFIRLNVLPDAGLHLIQVQNRNGRFSNDFIIQVVESATAAETLIAQRARDDRDIRDAIAQAIAEDDISDLRRHLNRRQQQGRINEPRPRTGSIPLSTAALHGRQEMIELLVRRGANINGSNRDGNTPLHVAAFLCREDVVTWLLEHGADLSKKNHRGQTAVDVIASPWSKETEDFYKFLDRSSNLKLDLPGIKKTRHQLARRLRMAASKKNSSSSNGNPSEPLDLQTRKENDE